MHTIILCLLSLFGSLIRPRFEAARSETHKHKLCINTKTPPLLIHAQRASKLILKHHCLVAVIMSGLLDLPNELIDKVADHLLPDTIEAFALSCRTIYVKCKYTLDKHHEYRAKYKIWSNHGPRRDDVFYFLCEIERDPLIAEYVETLSFWDRRASRKIEEVREQLGLEWRIWRDKEKMQRVMLMVGKKLGAYLEALSINTDYWYDRVRNEANPSDYRYRSSGTVTPVKSEIYRPIFGLISAFTVLCLLPHLRELALHPDFPGSPYDRGNNLLFPVRQLFRYRPRDGTYPLPYRPLEKLETLLPYETHGKDFVLLEHIRPFLELPGLKNVCSTSGVYLPGDSYFDEGYNIDDAPGYMEIMQDFNLEIGTLQLRRLELFASCLDPDGISILLHCCTQLEALKLAHETKRHDIGSPWDVAGCVSAMANTVGSSLKELYLRVIADDNELKRPISDFKRFSVLEKLETDVVLFTGYSSLTCPGPLASTLPPSIREVTLHFTPLEELHWIPPLVKGLSIARSTTLSKLEEVTLQNHTSGPGLKPDEKVKRAKEEYAETKKLAEAEGVRWIDNERFPSVEEWDEWTIDYRNRFPECFETQLFYDEDDDDDYPSVLSYMMAEFDSPHYSGGSPWNPDDSPARSQSSPGFMPASPTYESSP